MKKSNKLLIACASVLILIPVLGIAYVSMVYYEKGVRTGFEGVEMDPYGAMPKNVSTIDIGSQFQSVSIDGGNQLHLAVRLVNDDKSGVKFPNNMKGLISAKIDENGQLQITLKKSVEGQEKFTKIWIYGPETKQLSIANSLGTSLEAELDSMQLDLSSVSSAQFGRETNIAWLNIHTKDVNDITFQEASNKSVLLDVRGTNVRSNMSSFERLSIQASGNAEIELNGGDSEVNYKVIKHLELNTLGRTKVKIFNMQIDQCSGQFSDSTQVEMPALNINQMYKRKK